MRRCDPGLWLARLETETPNSNNQNDKNKIKRVTPLFGAPRQPRRHITTTRPRCTDALRRYVEPARGPGQGWCPMWRVLACGMLRKAAGAGRPVVVGRGAGGTAGRSQGSGRRVDRRADERGGEGLSGARERAGQWYGGGLGEGREMVGREERLRMGSVSSREGRPRGSATDGGTGTRGGGSGLERRGDSVWEVGAWLVGGQGAVGRSRPVACGEEVEGARRRGGGRSTVSTRGSEASGSGGSVGRRDAGGGRDSVSGKSKGLVGRRRLNAHAAHVRDVGGTRGRGGAREPGLERGCGPSGSGGCCVEVGVGRGWRFSGGGDGTRAQLGRQGGADAHALFLLSESTRVEAPWRARYNKLVSGLSSGYGVCHVM